MLDLTWTDQRNNFCGLLVQSASQFFVVRDEVGNVNFARILLDEYVFANLITTSSISILKQKVLWVNTADR